MLQGTREDIQNSFTVVAKMALKMAEREEEHVNEHTHLLPKPYQRKRSRLQSIAAEIDGESIVSSHVSKEEQALGETAVGERLPYNDYTTIDWLHDLVSNTSDQTDSR